MLVLILDSRCAAESARDALSLCAGTLIPSLFPLLVLGPMLVPSLAGLRLPLLSRVLRFPEGYFLLGCLGGYPLGAACITQAREQGILKGSAAERMVGLCSLCGPGFLFGVVGGQLSLRDAAAIFVLQIESALVTAAFWPGEPIRAVAPESGTVSLPDALNRGVSSMLSVCGWVTLAAVVAGFLRKWLFPFLPAGLSAVLTGLLELTNGIFSARDMGYEGQFLLCSLFCSFGGVSVLLQIAGLAGGLQMGPCILQKSIHGLLTTALAMLRLQFGGIMLLAVPAVLFVKKAVEIPGGMVYNVPRKEGI